MVTFWIPVIGIYYFFSATASFHKNHFRPPYVFFVTYLSCARVGGGVACRNRREKRLYFLRYALIALRTGKKSASTSRHYCDSRSNVYSTRDVGASFTCVKSTHHSAARCTASIRYAERFLMVSPARCRHKPYVCGVCVCVYSRPGVGRVRRVQTLTVEKLMYTK